MSWINEQANRSFFHYYPHVKDTLKALQHDFEITWGDQIKAYNTTVYAALAKPSQQIQEAYGIYRELLVVYSDFSNLEPRSIQAAESLFDRGPIKGRADNLVYIFISNDPRVYEWVEQYFFDNRESRILIPISRADITSNSRDIWYIRNVIRKNYQQRDLFNYTLPLVKDSFFYGREDIISDFLDAIRGSENRGLFGLRKTGKTSLLFKLRRIVEKDGMAEFFFYDCKKNHLRSSRWYELIEVIADDISQKLQVNTKDLTFSEREADSSFSKLIKRVKGNKRIVLVFDEIDFISPNAKRNKHWESDFLEFWQTMWACQSETRRILFIIAGVNPYCLEEPYVDGEQNPIFQIVPFKYLKGLSDTALDNKIRSLSSKMGISFSDDSINYVKERYGGHPLLSRMACSEIFQSKKETSEQFPIQINSSHILQRGEYWDMNIVTYCSHIIHELKESYTNEFDLLKHLAFNQIKEYLAGTKFSNQSKHLEGYGLVKLDDQTPKIALPVIEKYIKLEDARSEGRQTIFKLIPPNHRKEWLRSTINKIILEVRNIYRAIESDSFKSIFPHGTITEIDILTTSNVCNSQDDFSIFINQMYRSFAEPVDLFGKSIKSRDFFFNDFKQEFSDFFSGIHRIKLYRNNEKHLELTPGVEESLKGFLTQDLEGQDPSEFEELYFALQQCTLEGLLNSLVLENIKNIA